ncbi:MAG TPA: dephospho-CoA kinase, partial [Roseimicrobium sp.]|nr:dephospho-CoA kinase [Roseimicrobium sp.]
MILGLTGGMGGGKTTTARFFEAEGCRRIDSDAIVRDELLVMPEVVRQIQERFPDVIDSGTGRSNRALLGAQVFSDDEALAWLENLLH